jgi:hypothetical protein
MLSFLIKKGFNFDKKDKDGVRPIDLVKNVSNSNIYRKLVKVGVKEDKK